MNVVCGDCPRCFDGKLIEYVGRDWFEYCGKILYYRSWCSVCYKCSYTFVNSEQFVKNRREINRRKLEAGYDR